MQCRDSAAASLELQPAWPCSTRPIGNVFAGGRLREGTGSEMIVVFVSARPQDFT